MIYTAVPAPLRARTDLTAHLPELREALEQLRRFRIEQLAELVDDTSRDRPGATDPHEHVTLVLRAGANAALADIETALHRMATGSYGRCQRCAAAIPLERLEILPSAALCMACQHAQEADTR